MIRHAFGATMAPMSALMPAPSRAALTRDPLGHFFAGRTWLEFHAHHGKLSGLVFWERPDDHDVQDILASSARLSKKLTPHPSIIDIRALQWLDSVAFDRFVTFLSKQREVFDRIVTCAAVVHRGGLLGAAGAGVSNLIAFSNPVFISTDPLDALARIGRAEDAGLWAEIEALVDEVRGEPTILRRLAAFLESSPRATLAEAAVAVGMSERTLQRALLQHDTGFQRELDAARVRVAKRLLATSRAPVQTIAASAGCASSQHLDAIFRRVVGTSPSAWRKASTRTTPKK